MSVSSAALEVGNRCAVQGHLDPAGFATKDVTDLTYGGHGYRELLAPAESKPIIIRSDRSQGWYDFSIQMAESGPFFYRYAGRVETGKLSISDPAMAGHA